MIEQADHKLSAWFEEKLPKTPVRFTAPVSQEPGLNCWLFEIASAQPGRAADGKRPPLQVTVRYLVSATAADETQAHALLGSALVAALDTTGFEIGYCTLSLWSALGQPPRASFTISLVVRQDRPEPKVELVRHPAVVRAEFISSPKPSDHAVPASEK